MPRRRGAATTRSPTAAGRANGLRLVDHSHVSLYVASELVPGTSALNDRLSRALSDRPYAKWLQRLTALVLVVKLEKIAS